MTNSTNDDKKPSEVLRRELDAAIAEVTAAEQGLDAVLKELKAGVRAEKVTVTTAVEAAFLRLRKSREAVLAAREMVDEL